MKNPSAAVAVLSNPVESAGSKLHFCLAQVKMEFDCMRFM